MRLKLYWLLDFRSRRIRKCSYRKSRAEDSVCYLSSILIICAELSSSCSMFAFRCFFLQIIFFGVFSYWNLNWANKMFIGTIIKFESMFLDYQFVQLFLHTFLNWYRCFFFVYRNHPFYELQSHNVTSLFSTSHALLLEFFLTKYYTPGLLSYSRK